MPELSRAQARQLMVRAQLLDADRPTDLVELVDRLTLLQLDPTAAIAPNADLVAWSRLGNGYRPTDLIEAVDDRRLFELRAFVRPMSAVAWEVPERTSYATHPRIGDWLKANDRFRRDVLAKLGDEGPLLSKEIPDTCQQPWSSSGWTHDRNVTQLLELLSARGEVAISGRRGRQRLWDLPERVYDDVEPLTAQQALQRRAERRLRASGLARAGAPPVPGESYAVGEIGVPVTVEGSDGRWQADPELLARVGEPFHGRTALLSPFDRLIHDRGRAEKLFDFSYILEMYKPAAKRRWGYFALPILHRDRLVGKLDARADRKAGVLRVNAIHQDVAFSTSIRAGVQAEITALAGWLGLDLLQA